MDAATQRVFVAPIANGAGDLSVAPSVEDAVLTFSSDSGALLQRTALHLPVAALVPDPPAGRLLLLQQGVAGIEALDARSGRAAGFIPLGYTPAGLAVNTGTGLAYAIGLAGGFTPRLSIVDVRAMRLRRDVPIGPGSPRWIVIDARAGIVCVGSEQLTAGGASATRIAFLSARSGTLLHTVELPGGGLNAIVDARRGRLFVAHGAEIPAPTPLGTAATRRLQPVPCTNGSTIGCTPMQQVWDVPVFAIRTGARLATIPLSASAPYLPWEGETIWDSGASPLLAVDARSGHVLVALPQEGRLWLIDNRHVIRAIRRSITPFMTHLDVDERHGQALLSDERQVLAVDMRDGAVRRTVALSAGNDIAVDSATGHAFVLSMEPATIVPSDPWRWLPPGMRQHLAFVPPPPHPRAILGTVTTIVLAR